MHEFNAIADFLANNITVGGEDAKGANRLARMELLQLADEIGDRPHPSAMGGQNQISELAVYSGGTPSSGTYTLTFVRDRDSMTFMTTSDWDDQPVDVRGQIDAAAYSVVPGFGFTDIKVTGGPNLDSNPFDFNFSGKSVRRDKWTITGADIDLAPGTLGAISDTQVGANSRRGYAALFAGGVITDETMPTWGAATGWTVIPLGENRGPFRLTAALTRLIAKDISIHEGNPAIYTNLLTDLNITP
jgi:hypothetical protein